ILINSGFIRVFVSNLILHIMNHYVPDFATDEDYLLQDSSSLKRHKKSTMGDDDIMELLWQNGQVVMHNQNQNQRSVANNKKPETTTSGKEIRSGVMEDETTPCNLFMQEDEMASWLHYPIDDDNNNNNNNLDMYLHNNNNNNNIMYQGLPSSNSVIIPSSSSQPPLPPVVSVSVPPPRPPIPPVKRVEEEPSQPKFANFLHFSRPSRKLTGTGTGTGSGVGTSNKALPAMTQSTVVESNDRPVNEAQQSRASRVTDSNALVSGANVGFRGSIMSSFGGVGASSGGREPETYDLSASSSPGTGGSGASASVEPLSQKQPQPETAADRKRKGVDTDDTECYSESSIAKFLLAVQTKFIDCRLAAEFINEPMKYKFQCTFGVLLKLYLPRRTTASHDAEFEYHDAKKQKRGSASAKRTRAAEVHNLSERRRRDRINEKMKALQELIPRCNKMMSMGYNMVPMMFPGVQRYMPAMAPMGMGMGMEHVGMNRPMVPYPQVLPGSAMPNPAAAAAHLGQRYPVPRFQMAQVPIMGPTSSPTANMSDPMMNSYPMQNANQPRVPFADPYQQYIGLPQTQMLHPQAR
ncbi:hypothetical protein M8C21_005205, partial [Ambrosia artemisiifolia]